MTKTRKITLLYNKAHGAALLSVFWNNSIIYTKHQKNLYTAQPGTLNIAHKHLVHAELDTPTLISSKPAIQNLPVFL